MNNKRSKQSHYVLLPMLPNEEFSLKPCRCTRVLK